MEKFLHIHLLLSIIFSMVLVVLGNEKSFSPLNSSYIMEAKKRFMSFDITKLADPPRPSYTFSIYNRDLFEKSKFKDYDSLLENRLARSQARAKHLASILENGTRESKRDKVLITTMIHFQGQYVASFNLGTDQTHRRFLLVDTGSDLVWWQCGPCEPNKCYEQKYDPLYDLTSSTYRRPDCHLERITCLEKFNGFKCIETRNLCTYTYEYEDGTRTRGWIAEDRITFILDHSQVKILFGCGRDQTSGKAFSGDFSGVAGLGPRIRSGGYSLSSQFGADIMALCLPDFFSVNSTTLTFHTTPFKKTISAKLVPNDPTFPSSYSVNLYKLFVNNKEIPLSRSSCLVDTGTTVSRFPAALYTVFRDTFRNEVRGIPLSHAPVAPFDTCYMVAPGAVQHFPIVKMYFDRKNSKNLLLLEPRRVMLHVGGQYCLAFLPWGHPGALLASFQLQGIGLTFNTAANILSFDLDAC